MAGISNITSSWRERPPVVQTDRLAALEREAPATRRQLDRLIVLAQRGLVQTHENGRFVHTMRRVGRGQTESLRREGDNLRYAVNVALGLAFVDPAIQRTILDGRTARDLTIQCVERAEASNDTGAIALAAWTAAEASSIFAAQLFARLRTILTGTDPVDTVDCSWALIAAVAGMRLGDTRQLVTRARDRLLEGQGTSGLFPHHLPAASSGRLRAHIGCFADQVYSTQGLSRLYVATGDDVALAAAEASAAAICRLQGPLGQWWWHYDTRFGTVVEGYPVYSVHQHAMGPMALLDLWEAGGTNHMASIAKGLSWLDRSNEAGETMVSETDLLIWRKIGRREPRKLVRALSAATTASIPGLKVPGLDTIFPPGQIDHECRPYELGWLLYAWLSSGTVASLGTDREARYG